MTIKLTEADCQNVTWRVVETTPLYRISIGHGTHPVSGVEFTVERKEYLAEDTLLDLNAERRNNTANKRWSAGAGSEKNGNVPMIHVGSIPMNKFFADCADGVRTGDSDHLRWYLNRDENQPFRTRTGKL